jgi:hypothetical protein
VDLGKLSGDYFWCAVSGAVIYDNDRDVIYLGFGDLFRYLRQNMLGIVLSISYWKSYTDEGHFLISESSI